MNRIAHSWERLRSTPGLAKDAIIVVSVALVGILASTYVFGQYDFQTPWSKNIEVKADFTKAPGVRPTSRQEVRIAGVTVGRIASATSTKDGNARLTLSIEPGHTIYSNARLVLRSKSPVNVMYVALDPGGPPADPLPAGAVIPVSQTQRLVEPHVLLDNLDSRTQVALTSLINQADAALAESQRTLPAGLDATGKTLESFRPVLVQLQKRRDAIAELVTSLSRIATAVGSDQGRLARLTSGLHTTLGVLSKRDRELSATLDQLPGFAGELRHAMASTGALTKELNPTLDALREASDTLPEALTKLTDTVDQANRLVRSATPVVAKARPVIADLRPLASNLNGALGNLRPVAAHLPSATKKIVPWLDDLAAFVYQTSSAFSLSDVNGGLGRANVVLDISNPTGGLAPEPDVKKGR